MGRAWVYALAARGRAGVTQLLDIIEQEMRVVMALTGCTRIERIDRTLLAGPLPGHIVGDGHSRSAVSCSGDQDT